MSRFTVMGFTEAELGFFLAGVLAAVAGSGTSAAQSKTRVEKEARMSIEARADSLNRLAGELQLKVDSLSASLASTRKLSDRIPKCSEKGQSQVVATVLVRPGPMLVVDGVEMPPRELGSHLDNFVKLSERLGCRFSVVTRADSGVDGRDVLEAQGIIRNWFIT